MVVLIWCLMVEELSPGLSAFWGVAVLILLMLTQRPLIAVFRREHDLATPLRAGFADLLSGLTAAARNMTTVGIATSTAGIIVGTVLLTGVGLVMTEVVEIVSGGSLLIMLFLTAIICLILGMGMPTTASYVVVATLMAPVVVDLAAKNGLAVPLVAVHMFVFYFGLMADVTPPVGLAAFAASAISGADPVKTGVQAFRYEIRTALLPFIFIFNHQMLMIDIETPLEFLTVVGSASAAMACFVGATQLWFLTRNRWYETLVLVACCFVLFRPGYCLDQLYEPFNFVEPAQVFAVADASEDDDPVFLRFETQSTAGDVIEKLVRIRLGEGKTGSQRLAASGLMLNRMGDEVSVSSVKLGSLAAKFGIRGGDRITALALPTDRPSKYWFLLPALLAMTLVILAQHRRRKRELAAA